MTTPLGDAWQVLSDCPHCLVEAAVVELMDPLHPACHLGIPVEVRCRMCGWTVAAEDEPFAPRQPLAAGRCPACQTRLDEAARTGHAPCSKCGYQPRTAIVSDPDDVVREDVARRRLTEWAADEGEADVDAFCRSNMGKSADDVVSLLTSRRPVPTTFDVIAWLFPQGGRGSAEEALGRHVDLVDRVPEPPPPEVTETLDLDRHEAMDPRTPARVLISVMVADGDLRSGELRFVQRFLEREGLEPMHPNDLRVWRPHELGFVEPAMRDKLVEAAVHVAHLDRERDGSEWKVILAFARAWGVPDEKVQAWDRLYDQKYATAMTRLWRALSQMVRVR